MRAAKSAQGEGDRLFGKATVSQMSGKIEIVQTQKQMTAVIHLVIPRAEIQAVMGAAIGEVLAALTAQGLAPAGPLFSYHLQRPSNVFDFEVGFPVNSAVLSAGRVKCSSLPASTVARTAYRGGYEGLGAAWGAHFVQIQARGLVAQGDLWECYLSGPERSPDPAHWATELNCPVHS